MNMKGLKKLVVLLLFIIFLILQTPLIKGAGVCEPCDGETCDPGLECINGVCQKPNGITICPPIKAKTFEDLIKSIIGFVFKIALAIAPIMIIIAGFLFVTSGGSPEQINKAKK